MGQLVELEELVGSENHFLDKRLSIEKGSNRKWFSDTKDAQEQLFEMQGIYGIQPGCLDRRQQAK